MIRTTCALGQHLKPHNTSITAIFRFYTNARFTLETASPHDDGQSLWQQAMEVLSVGGSIGIAVVVVRTFTVSGTQPQWMAFALAALLLTFLHCMLRQSIRSLVAALALQLLTYHRRSRIFERFANEANANWMGLMEPLELEKTLRPSHDY